LAIRQLNPVLILYVEKWAFYGEVLHVSPLMKIYETIVSFSCQMKLNVIFFQWMPHINNK